MTDAEFEFLAARTGIPFNAAQKEAIKGAVPVIERFVAINSKPAAPAMAK